jgi:hypothetical protein
MLGDWASRRLKNFRRRNRANPSPPWSRTRKDSTTFRKTTLSTSTAALWERSSPAPRPSWKCWPKAVAPPTAGGRGCASAGRLRGEWAWRPSPEPSSASSRQANGQARPAKGSTGLPKLALEPLMCSSSRGAWLRLRKPPVRTRSAAHSSRRIRTRAAKWKGSYAPAISRSSVTEGFNRRFKAGGSWLAPRGDADHKAADRLNLAFHGDSPWPTGPRSPVRERRPCGIRSPR